MRVTPFGRFKRLLDTIVAHLHEYGWLNAEQPVLALIARKSQELASRSADRAAHFAMLKDTYEAAAQRLAQLEGRRINKAVFAVRFGVLSLPAAIRSPLRNVLRRALNPAFQPPCGYWRDPDRRRPLAAVPFAATFPPPSLQTPLGVVMHIYYPELVGEMLAYLENIPGPVDLYVSTDTAEKHAMLEQALAGWTAGAVQIRLAANRGRDIAPKLITFRDVYDRHPIVLHLHSKKSPHGSHLRMWRYFLFENLMGERTIAASILSALEHVPELGMVASSHYFAVSNGITWGDNLYGALALAARMRIAIDPAAPFDFPSGSMFWAKSAALKPLLNLNLSAEDFPAESGQKDGTLAHAIERLYLIAARTAGFEWIQVSRPCLVLEETRLAHIAQVSDIEALVQGTATHPNGLRRRRVLAAALTRQLTAPKSGTHGTNR